MPSSTGPALLALERDGEQDTLRSYVRLFVVDSGGGRPRPWSSKLGTGTSFDVQIAWSPDSSRLAACDTTPGHGSQVFDRDSCYLVGPGQRQRLIARAEDRRGRADDHLLYPVWSVDGRLIALSAGTFDHQQVLVVTPTGRRVLRAPGGPGAKVWSARGDLAVFYRGAVRVYDRGGRVKARVPSAGFYSYAWSPEGDRLAVVRRTGVEVRSARGRLLFRKPIAALHLRYLFESPQIRWLDGDTLIVSGPPEESPQGVFVDLRSGRVYGRFGEGWLSPQGTRLARVERRGQTTTLTVSRRDGSDRRVLVRRKPCRDPIARLEWLPDSRSLVYDFRCDVS